METYLKLVADTTITIWLWLGSAFHDARVMVEAAGQHATAKAFFLIAFAVFLLPSLIVTVQRIRRTSALKTRTQRERDRLTLAIAGYSKFLGRAPIDEPSRSFEVSGIPSSSKQAASTRRTETKVMDVPPYGEQRIIDLLAHFGWELQSSTPVHNKDSHLERRGDTIYSVTETEDYIHLVFVRDLNMPHIGRLRQLEAEYFSITLPRIPGYVGPILLAVFVGAPTYGIAAILAIIWAVNISGRREKAKEEKERLLARQEEILREANNLLENSASEMAA